MKKRKAERALGNILHLLDLTLRGIRRYGRVKQGAYLAIFAFLKTTLAVV